MSKNKFCYVIEIPNCLSCSGCACSGPTGPPGESILGPTGPTGSSALATNSSIFRFSSGAQTIVAGSSFIGVQSASSNADDVSFVVGKSIIYKSLTLSVKGGSYGGTIVQAVLSVSTDGGITYNDVGNLTNVNGGEICNTNMSNVNINPCDFITVRITVVGPNVRITAAVTYDIV